MHGFHRVWRFVTSIKFGVVLMLLLMLVMMFATQFEASTSTRAMKHFIYGSAWFDAGVFLFVLNLVINTLRRRPYRFRHAGFLTVHTGVLTIVAGGLMTRYFGVDGTMPIAEGDTGRAILLPENDVIVEAMGKTYSFATHYDLQPWREGHDDVFAIPETKYAIRVDRYYPSAAVTDTLIEGTTGNGPILQVALGDGETSPTSGWLVARDPVQSMARVGNVTIHFVESAGLPPLEEKWQREANASAQPAKSAPADAGKLQLFWADGGSETISVAGAGEEPIRTSRPGIAIHIDQVFHSFVLTESGYAEGADAPENPAIRFHVVDATGDHEDHFAFAHFPEFRMSPPEGEEHVLSHATWSPSPGGAAPGKDVEVAFEWRDGAIYTYTSWDHPLHGAPITVGETRAFESPRVFLRILQAAPEGRISRTVTRTSDEVTNPVLHVRLEEESGSGVRHAGLFDLLRGGKALQPAAVDPNRAWVFHGMSHEFAMPEGTIKVRYESRTIPLAFGIQLDDFIERSYPGIAMAASYESHVQVLPEHGEPFSKKIYMNNPLKYAGYTFYQASFQRTPEGEITVLSVAQDPGMTVSFVGYCILVAGLLLIFFVKPALRRLDDRIARSRAAGGSA
jgi:hypothetical protein